MPLILLLSKLQHVCLEQGMYHLLWHCQWMSGLVCINQKPRWKLWTAEEGRNESRICLLPQCLWRFYRCWFPQSQDTCCLKVDSSSSFQGMNLTNWGGEEQDYRYTYCCHKAKSCAAVTSNLQTYLFVFFLFCHTRNSFKAVFRISLLWSHWNITQIMKRLCLTRKISP